MGIFALKLKKYLNFIRLREFDGLHRHRDESIILEQNPDQFEQESYSITIIAVGVWLMLVFHGVCTCRSLPDRRYFLTIQAASLIKEAPSLLCEAWFMMRGGV